MHSIERGKGRMMGGGGVGRLSLRPNFKGEDLTGPQLLEGSCWERQGDFFQGGGLQIKI